MPRPLLFLLLVAGALLPGIVLSIGVTGLFGSAIPDGRLLSWPGQIDVSIAFQAIAHMQHTPWSDGLLRASTFEGGTHISMVDGWPLFALAVRLFDVDPVALLKVMAVFTFPLIAGAAALVAREMGARTLPQLVAAASVAVLSAPALVRFDPHPHVAQLETLIVAAAVALALPRSPRPRLLLVIGTVAAVAGFLLYPYIGAGALLLLGGGIVDRARRSPRAAAWSFVLRAGGAVLAVFAAVFALGGYLDGDVSSVAGGYGMMGLNLLAPFYPVACDWCTPLPSLGPAPFWQDFNGAAFMGGGVLLAMVIAAVRLGRGGIAAALRPRLGLVGGLTLGVAYAIGTHAAIGPFVLYAVELPEGFPGASLFQSLRMSAGLAWPALLMVAIGAVVAALAPSRAGAGRRAARNYGLALLAVGVIAVQAASFWPIVSVIGGEQRSNAPVRPELTLLERVVATSPGGVRITPPINCRPSWRGGPLFASEFDLAHQLGRLTGTAGIPFAGARNVRLPTWDWCAIPTSAETAAQRAAGWSILYQGAIGKTVLRPSPAEGCVALPGYLLCPADPRALAGDAWVQTASLPLDPTLGLPLLPADGLRAPDPRLDAAVAGSGGFWTHHFIEDPWSTAPYRDVRDFEAVTALGVEQDPTIAIAWDVRAGRRLIATFAARPNAPETAVVVDSAEVAWEGLTATILGRCDATRCVVDTPLGLNLGRLDLLALQIAP